MARTVGWEARTTLSRVGSGPGMPLPESSYPRCPPQQVASLVSITELNEKKNHISLWPAFNNL